MIERHFNEQTGQWVTREFDKLAQVWRVLDIETAAPSVSRPEGNRSQTAQPLPTLGEVARPHAEPTSITAWALANPHAATTSAKEWALADSIGPEDSPGTDGQVSSTLQFNDESQTVSGQGKLVRFGGSIQYQAFKKIYANRPNAVTLDSVCASQADRRIVSDLRKSLREEGAPEWAAAIKNQRYTGYYFEAPQ